MGSGNVQSQIQICIFCWSLMCTLQAHFKQKWFRLGLHCYINAVQLVWFGGIVSTWGEEFPAAVGMSIQSGQMQGEHAVNPSSAEEYRGEWQSLSETTSYDALPIFLTKIQMQSNLVQSAPLVIRVFIKSSWPYRAATCSGVFPSLSTQSISPPVSKTHSCTHNAPANQCISKSNAV